MRQIITISPKREKYVPVSRTTSPVTHVAELAVKYASRKLVGVPVEDDIGRLRSIPPVNMTRKKLITIRVLGFNFMARLYYKCYPPSTTHLSFSMYQSLGAFRYSSVSERSS